MELIRLNFVRTREKRDDKSSLNIANRVVLLKLEKTGNGR